MNKKIIIIVAIILAILSVIFVAGYFYIKNKKASNTAEKIIEDATKGVLPSLQTNPLENKPDINPAGNANPIKNIKTNPFE